MPPRVFIDGHVGTVALRIRELLSGRDELDVVTVDEARRKDPEARRELLDAADLAILCLPDEAAREAVAMLDGAKTRVSDAKTRVSDAKTRVIDASTAHRVTPGWCFGLPELGAGQRAEIRAATRVTNPGCYPSAVVLALRPLVDAGLVPSSAPIAVHALSGYSGGGRPLVERWEDAGRGLLQHLHEAPYALDRVHKHIDEMTRYSGLEHPPHFVPAVGPFRCGMRVEIPLHGSLIAPGATAKSIWETLDTRYAKERFVHVAPFREPLDPDEDSFDPQALNDSNDLEIAVVGNPLGHVLLLVRLDNLGKGAAGVAVQSLNLMLGLPEASGLTGRE